MAQRTRSILYVFLASPGGLDVERQSARDVAEEINRTFADATGWQVEMLGWEDTLPGYGRPQEIINRDVDRCDIFLGLLHRRWGQSTGKAGITSGFQEEFERAVARRRTSGAPEIRMVFKRVDDASDPGEQLTRVIEFRNSLIASKELLFSEVADTDEWERSLREMLAREILNRMGQVSGSLTRSESIEEPAPADRSVAVGDDSVAPSSAEFPIPTQVMGVLQKLLALPHEGQVTSFGEVLEKLEAFEVLRFHLAAEAALGLRFNSDPLGTHEINRLYLRRAELELALPEIHLLLRTVISGDASDVNPGWFWFAQAYGRNSDLFLTFFMLYDANEEVRERAVRLLASGGRLPTRFRRKGTKVRAEFVRSLLKDKSNRVQTAVVDLLERVCDASDLPAIGAAVSAGSTFPRDDLDRLTSILSADDDPTTAFRNYVREGPPRRWVDELFAKHRATLSEDDLRLALKHEDTALREFAAVTLFERNALTTDDAVLLTGDGLRVLRAIGYIAGASCGEEIVDPALVRKAISVENEIFDKGLKKVPLVRNFGWEVLSGVDAVVFATIRSQSAEQIIEQIEWYGEGWLAYLAIATEHFEEHRDRIRSDLRDGFRRIEQAHADDLIRSHGEAGRRWLAENPNPGVAEFVRSRFATAALIGIAEHGNRRDAVLARPYLLRGHETSRAAVKVLSRFGDTSDIEPLLTLSRREYGVLKVESARAALDVSDSTDSRVPNQLLASDDTELVRTTIGWLLDKRNDSNTYTPELRALLYSPKDDIRLLGIAYFVHRGSRQTLVDLLEAYPSEKDSYFYNVVVWIDRVLNAPEPFNRHYRNRLRAAISKS
jgi:hypothetical protein